MHVWNEYILSLKDWGPKGSIAFVISVSAEQIKYDYVTQQGGWYLGHCGGLVGLPYKWVAKLYLHKVSMVTAQCRQLSKYSYISYIWSAQNRFQGESFGMPFISEMW